MGVLFVVSWKRNHERNVVSGQRFEKLMDSFCMGNLNLGREEIVKETWISLPYFI